MSLTQTFTHSSVSPHGVWFRYQVRCSSWNIRKYRICVSSSNGVNRCCGRGNGPGALFVVGMVVAPAIRDLAIRSAILVSSKYVQTRSDRSHTLHDGRCSSHFTRRALASGQTFHVPRTGHIPASPTSQPALSMTPLHSSCLTRVCHPDGASRNQQDSLCLLTQTQISIALEGLKGARKNKPEHRR
jgi:hypothetical protein